MSTICINSFGKWAIVQYLVNIMPRKPSSRAIYRENRIQQLEYGLYNDLSVDKLLVTHGQRRENLYHHKTNRFFHYYPEQQIQEGFSLPQTNRWRSMKTQGSFIVAIR